MAQVQNDTKGNLYVECDVCSTHVYLIDDCNVCDDCEAVYDFTGERKPQGDEYPDPVDCAWY